MSSAKTTTDHDVIRKWAEERDGVPSTVKGTAPPGDEGVLRIDFPGGSEDAFEHIEWDEFFDKFDEKKLAFLYQEQTEDGSTSRFCKFVARE